LALATLALLLSAAIGLAFPQIVRYLLDAAFLRRDRALLDRIALLLLALFAVQAGLNFIQTYYLSATGERAVAGLRRELFDKLLTMPPDSSPTAAPASLPVASPRTSACCRAS
jgi:ABC-type bacteriocin/lantibiotic exporter with double-glycine peptidase domain